MPITIRGVYQRRCQSENDRLPFEKVPGVSASLRLKVVALCVAVFSTPRGVTCTEMSCHGE